MTIKAQMAGDLEQVLNDDAFDEAGTYYPKDSAEGFAVRLVRGDITTGTGTFEQGTEHTRVTQAILLRSVVRAGIADIEGTARDPVRGDKITMDDDDEDEADWYVATLGAVDVGGGITVQLECNDYGSPGGRDATEVR